MRPVVHSERNTIKVLYSLLQAVEFEGRKDQSVEPERITEK